MKKIIVILCTVLLVFGLAACKKTADNNNEKRPVVVLPESSVPEVTVNTESSTETRYIANKSSKVYHKENCTAVSKMKEENKVKFEKSKDAENEGYSPCGICLK